MKFQKGHIGWNKGKKGLQVAWNKGKTGIYSEEAREKMSQSHKGLMAGSKNPMFGRSGNLSPIFGKHHSPETRKKISDANMGNKSRLGMKHSPETKQKISEANKGEKNYWFGKNFSKEHKKKLSELHKGQIPWCAGKHHSPETKQKMSLAQIGARHWNWRGGISNNPYPQEFNPALKLKIRTRDNFTCCLCGKTEREELEELNRVLSVNHIDFDKNNCQESNLNTLCLRCNVKINRERDQWTEYFNNNR